MLVGPPLGGQNVAGGTQWARRGIQDQAGSTARARPLLSMTRCCRSEGAEWRTVLHPRARGSGELVVLGYPRRGSVVGDHDTSFFSYSGLFAPGVVQCG